MNRFFKKFKNKKNKWLYYLLFWIFFPLTIIGLITSFCYIPNQMSNNRSTEYTQSTEISVNFANNSNDIHSLSNTQQEARTAAKNYLLALKLSGLASVNIQPYVYSKVVNDATNYYYGLNLVFANETSTSLFNSYVSVNTFYDSSNLMNLDFVQQKETNNVVQNRTSSSDLSRTYYAYNTVAGVIPTNNNNDEFISAINNFDYKTAKLAITDGHPYLNIDLNNRVNLSNIITNTNDQYLWWTNKAAFVAFCNNLYSLYWLNQQWPNLQNVIPSNLYTISCHNVIRNLLTTFNNNFQGFAQSLYQIIGSNNYISFNSSTIPHAGSLTKNYNLITLQNIDNILLTKIPGTSKTLYSKYSSQLNSYILADINSTNYKKYFSNISGQESNVLTLNMTNELQYSANELSRIYLLIQQWKDNLLNPVISPKNIRNTNANTYSNVNINPFNIWSNINNLLVANNTYSSAPSTNTMIALPKAKLVFNPTTIIIPFSTNSYQTSNIVNTSHYILSNSVTHISAWKAIFISILVIILIIGILVSILYRFPGFIVWIISSATLGISALTYHDLALITSNGSLFAYLISYIMTLFIFIIFLQKTEEFYRSGISYILAFEKGIRYFVTYGLDLHILVFLTSLAFVYFASFELQTIGIVIAIYFALSFLINYLIGWFILFIFNNFDLNINYNFYTTKYSYKSNIKNYEYVSQFALSVDPEGHYDLSAFDAILSNKSKLSIYLKPTKKVNWFLRISFILALVFMLTFAIVAIIIYFKIGYYVYPDLKNHLTHNISANFLFDQILTTILIGNGFSCIYMLIRFGKSIIYFITSSISAYLMISFFLMCTFNRSIQNIEGVVFSIFLSIFINAYINVLINHLFKFKTEITKSESLNMMKNVIFNNKNTYFIFAIIMSLVLIINLILNSSDLFVLDFLLFVPFVTVWFSSFIFSIYLRFIYVLIKNEFFKVESKVQRKNYDTIEEQIIEGINEFSIKQRESFIYE